MKFQLIYNDWYKFKELNNYYVGQFLGYDENNKDIYYFKLWYKQDNQLYFEVILFSKFDIIITEYLGSGYDFIINEKGF